MGGSIQGTPLNLSGIVTTFAGPAQWTMSADDTGSAAGFYEPYGVVSDGTNLFVTDYQNHTIRKIVIATGQVTTFAGMAGVPGSDNGTGSTSRFFLPSDITTDGVNLYVTDSGNHTIRKIEISTGAVSTLAGMAGTAGSADGTGSAARFNSPFGITTDLTNLYVTDSGNHTIRQIVIGTGAVTTLAGS